MEGFKPRETPDSTCIILRVPTPAARAQSTIGNRPSAILLVCLFAALLLTHLPFLRLPYFWDEAGYYIPASRDLLLSGTLIPTSTLTNAHPPLVMAYLAAAWKLFGYSPLVTRAALLLIAAFTLLAVYHLARQVVNREVAFASLVCTALFPVVFSQSMMAHLDLAAAGLILWGIHFYLRQRHLVALIFLSLACLSKETAALVPLTVFAWDLIMSSIGNRQSTIGNSVRIYRSLVLLLSLIPLCAWFAFHYARTGHVFGNPDFVRYNIEATLHPVRFLAALALRLWHLFGYMSMFLLTLLTAAAMFFSPRSDAGGTQIPAIAPRVQGLFYLLILVHVVALSIVGGAVLARYLLPVYPLVLIVGISTLRRRLPLWPAFVGIICAGFLLSLLANPPYRFAPEDNLAWTDYVRLHQSADAFVAQRYSAGRVLTAWPASDELTRPDLGYVARAVPIVRIEDFSATQILSAAEVRSTYRAALVFSTKYEPRHLLRISGWERLQERFFGYHRDLPTEFIARALGARVVFRQQRRQQWVAVLEVESNEYAGVEDLKGVYLEIKN
jgi:4-amino-4-deoxy-L-arabinose transferase-like glycosyltransferase